MKILNGLLKFLAVLAFSIAAGLLVIIFVSGQPQINDFWLRIVFLSAIGFIGGLFMRVLFRKGFALLDILIVLITSTASVLIIDNFYETEYFFTFLGEGGVFSVPSSSDIGQLALLLTLSLPPILLFRRKRTKKTQQVVEPKPQPSGQTFSDRVKVAAYQVNPRNWNINLPSFKGKAKPAATKSPSSGKKVSISVPSESKTLPTAKIKSNGNKKSSAGMKIKLPSFNKKHANNDVKLMGAEEHVCPYCLEEVTRDDPHGVEICDECHTWHHRDCWSITGGCGVAHRNKL